MIQYNKGVENSFFIDHTGENYISNDGLDMEIINCKGSRNCDVRFKDGTIVYNKTYDNIKNGRVNNPNHRSIFGVGYEGIGKYSSKMYSLLYRKWHNMLKRCYDKDWQKNNPSYTDCSVDERFHCLQDFGKWFEENWKSWMDEKWDLDKDLLSNNKTYSPDTCCFLPQELNKKFKKFKKKENGLPTGVFLHTNNKYRAWLVTKNKFSKVVDTIEEAILIHKIDSELDIKNIAKRYKNKLTEQVYQKLIYYEIHY